MERRRLIINFKNTAEDIALYEKIKNHSSISGYVKDILRGLVKENSTGSVQPVQNNASKDELNDSINNILGSV
ncbi:MAG: hypothetical protein Q8933_09315 [Bacteroidota bacterium]|nr:hypothetical protein [Bacteroidota bacterium]